MRDCYQYYGRIRFQFCLQVKNLTKQMNAVISMISCIQCLLYLLCRFLTPNYICACEYKYSLCAICNTFMRTIQRSTEREHCTACMQYIL